MDKKKSASTGKKKPPAAVESLNTVKRHAHSGAGPRRAKDVRAREAAPEQAPDDEGRAERMRSFAERCAQGERAASFPWKRASGETRRKYRRPGQPMAFASAEEFYEGILSYFQQCDTHMTLLEVKSRAAGTTMVSVADPLPKDVAELCSFLGISRQTFYNYLAPAHPYHVVADWFEMESEISWKKQLLNPKRMKAAQFILQAKYKYVMQKDIVSDGKALAVSPLRALMDEIDGTGFELPEQVTSEA